VTSFTTTPEGIAAYAEAIGAAPAHPAPPLYAFVCAWGALLGSVHQTLPQDALARVVHLAQDVVVLRPIEAGDTVHSRANVSAVVPGRAGTSVEVLTTSEFAQLRTTLFVAGAQLPAIAEAAAAPVAPRGEPVATVESKVAEDQAVRYAQASGDLNPIHLDGDAARAAGLPGVVLHGMCTLAMAVEAITHGAVRRVSARFSKPVRPGDVLRTTYWLSEPGVYGFKTESEGGLAIKHGVLEQPSFSQE
jgi:acyl dehydratase